eukprot:Rmarinus@m.13262
MLLRRSWALLAAVLILWCIQVGGDGVSPLVSFIDEQITEANGSGNRLYLEEAELLCEKRVQALRAELHDRVERMGTNDEVCSKLLELGDLERVWAKVLGHLGRFPDAIKTVALAVEEYRRIAGYSTSESNRDVAMSRLQAVNTDYNGLPPQSGVIGPGPAFDHALLDTPTHRTIHFVVSQPTTHLGERLRCAIESAGRENPDAVVAVWANALQGHHLWSEDERRSLAGDIRFIPYQFHHVFRFTPLLQWYTEQYREEGFFLNNLSNAMRLALLYKYGGVYMDTDVLSLRSIVDVRNTVGAERNECLDEDKEIDADTHCSSDSGIPYTNSLCNAVLSFDQGHPFLWALMQDFKNDYRGTQWAHNGPWCLNRVYPTWHAGNVTLTGTDFAPVNVLPKQAFYGIGWAHLQDLLYGEHGDVGMRYLNVSTPVRPYLLHIWNSSSKAADVQPGSVLQRMMREHCPITYRRSRARFNMEVQNGIDLYLRQQYPQSLIHLRAAFEITADDLSLLVLKANVEYLVGDAMVAKSHLDVLSMRLDDLEEGQRDAYHSLRPAVDNVIEREL